MQCLIREQNDMVLAKPIRGLQPHILMLPAYLTFEQVFTTDLHNTGTLCQ